MVGSLVNNRSPSPNARTNNQERGGGVEGSKSFSGHPFVHSSQQCSFLGHTSANRPAGYGSRSSFGKECGGGVQFRGNEQKENEKDPNMMPITKNKSPSVITKGTKNFMSPTISATSKINPSPRKKVLGERNEAIRSSASFSDGKFNFSTSSSEFGENTSVTEHNPPCSRAIDFEKVGNDFSTMEPDKSFNFSEQFQADVLDTVVLSPEIAVNAAKSSEGLPLSEMPKFLADKNVGLSVKDAGFTSPCSIAPLDADPSAQPYDPKTNYLSPRPQFLRYRPIPRIDSYNQEGISFEDVFGSKSVSETDLSEVQTEDTQEEQEDAASSATTLPVKEKPESPSGSSSTVQQQVKEAAGAKPELIARKNTKWKSVVLLVLFVFGSLSIPMIYTGFGNAVYQDKTVGNYSDPYAASELVKEHWNFLLQNAKIWSAHSVVYLSQVIHNARVFDKSAQLVFSNLTEWPKEENDQMVRDFVLEPYFESVEDEPISGIDRNFEIYTESEDDEDSIEMPSYQTAEGVLSVPAEYQEPVGPKIELVSSFDEPDNLESSVANPQEHEIQPQVEAVYGPMVEVENRPQVEAANEPLAETASDLQVKATDEPLAECDVRFAEGGQSEETTMPKLASENLAPEVSVENSLPAETSEKNMFPISVAVSLVVVLLLAAATFMYVKQKKAPSADHLTLDEKPKYQYTGSNIEQSVHEAPSTWSSPIEVDMTGESCSSEMSSFQNYSSHNKRDCKDSEEAQSRQKSSKRSHKRESLATSSDYTTSSFGSFTTYSIIHPKRGDEEIVTPIRRSSRIRTKVTSP